MRLLDESPGFVFTLSEVRASKRPSLAFYGCHRVLDNDDLSGKTWPPSVGSSFRGHSRVDVPYRFNTEDTVMETNERDKDVQLL